MLYDVYHLPRTLPGLVITKYIMCWLKLLVSVVAITSHRSTREENTQLTGRRICQTLCQVSVAESEIGLLFLYGLRINIAVMQW